MPQFVESNIRQLFTNIAPDLLSGEAFAGVRMVV